MSDIYNLLNNATDEKVEEKPRIPPEEYAKQKQQKRQNLYDMAEKQTHEVVSSPIHSWSWHNVHRQHC